MVRPFPAKELAELRGRVANIRVRTPECDEANRRFGHWYLATLSGIPMCSLIDGESGTGKSVALEMLHRSLLSKRTDDGIQQRGVLLTVPSKPTPISLIEEVLRALGDPRPQQGTRNTKMARLVESIRTQRVLFLFLDELQHIVDKGSGVVIYDTSECLKELLGRVCCSVICAGLPEASRVVDANEQLRRRYCAPVHMRRYSWDEPAAQATLKGVLRAFRKKLPEFDMPPLESEEMAMRFYLATGGILDFVAKTLMWATWIALDDGRRTVRLADLELGWPNALWQAERVDYNPFSRSLPSGPKLHALMTQAKQLNAAVPRPMRKATLAQVGL